MNNTVAARHGSLQSGPSRRPSFVRFVNITTRCIDVIWVNYQGHYVRLSTLGPRQFFDTNTYVSHPWIFRDSATRDKLVVKSKEVFYPEPWDVGLSFTGRHSLQRKLVLITLPVYSLKERCFQILRNYLKNADDAFLLDIPRTLQLEFVRFMQRPREEAQLFMRVRDEDDESEAEQ